MIWVHFFCVGNYSKSGSTKSKTLVLLFVPILENLESKFCSIFSKYQKNDLAIFRINLTVEGIEVSGIQIILNTAQTFTESLKMYDFPLS